jgi:hypothetical protein
MVARDAVVAEEVAAFNRLFERRHEPALAVPAFTREPASQRGRSSQDVTSNP